MALGGRSRTGIITIPIGGGIVADEVEHELSDPICTDGNNVRFRDGYVRKTEGYEAVFTAPSAAAQHIATLQAPGNQYWVHATTSGLFADNGSTRTTITGSALTGSAADKFTSCVLGGVLVINNGADVPQYWGGSGTAAALTAWDSSWRCKALRSFKNYLIALNVTKSGVNYGSMVKWSHAAEPGTLPDSWDETDPTRDAGENDVAETDDDIVDGLPIGNTFVVYKERSAYGMQFVPSNEIFRFFRLPGNPGALAANCVADTPVGHVVLTNGPDVVRHYANEPQSIVTGKWKTWLRDNIDTDNYRKSFVVANTQKSEVWICIPTTGNSYCNKALVWNWEQDTFGLVSLPNVTHAAVGRLQSSSAFIDSVSTNIDSVSTLVDTFDASERMLMSGSTKLYVMDEGDDADGVALTSTFSRVGLSFGDADAVKLLRGVVPRVDAPAGTVLSIEGAYSDDIEGPYSYTSPVTYIVGTSRRADFRCRGRFVGVRFTSADAGPWRIKSIGYDVVGMGER